MACSPITLWQIEGKTMEIVILFVNKTAIKGKAFLGTPLVVQW